MNNHSFLWHDYETFGAVPRQDKPAQFAGIRTDHELNEIGEPVMIYCTPTTDYLPSPEACLLTGITPQHCQQQGIRECEFASIIERELAAPGTIGVGYNSIRFDDEVTRFLFWRNLIDPYAREWQNQCGRWDLLDVVRAAYALRPEGIAWPINEQGKTSFKLEHLSQANGLQHETAHDALSDVRATIALARLIRQTQPKLFDYALSLRKKDKVRQEISLHAPKPFLHISGMYGTDKGNLAIVWPLAQHPSNNNEIIVWDLSYDPSVLKGLSAEEIKQRLFQKAEMLPNADSRLPIKTIHINKSPFVTSQLKVLSEERARHWQLDMDSIMRHAELAAALPPLPHIWQTVFSRELARLDVDENLYGGFVSNNDRRILTRLRQLPAKQLGSEHPAFEDNQLHELFFRYRARNFPELLAENEQLKWQTWCHRKLHAEDSTARTYASYHAELEMLEQSVTSPAKQAIITALKAYHPA